MSGINTASMYGRLDPLAYRALESAINACKLRGNPKVELVHFVEQFFVMQDSDVHRIMREFSADPSRLAGDLSAALEKLPRGASTIHEVSDDLGVATKEGWLYATLLFNESRIRSGHLVIGMLKDEHLRKSLVAMSREFSKVNVDTLIDKFAAIVKDSPETAMMAESGPVGGGAAPGETSGAIAPAQLGKQEALNKFSVDLTEKARKGEIDPVVGRDEEIRQMIDILMRRRQNNPLLTGEAGVGKTAVVEGFALRIANGDVPPMLKDVSLRSVDIGLLQAGASMKGEFENRLKQVIEEVQSSEKPIILFIDEVHTLIGAGGAAGTGDAANLLKPALARGKLRTVAATTWAEYKKYIEKDPALTRRFQTVQVHEPDEIKAILMMRGVVATLEKHHRVQVLDEAIEAAVKLSHRYIPSRQLPDKSVSLLDTACARVAVSQHATPADIEDSRRRIEALEIELGIIGRETAVGIETTKRLADASEKLTGEKARLTALEARWTDEKVLVDKLLALRAELRKEHDADSTTVTPERAEKLERLRGLQGELQTMQGQRPLILPSVDHQAVAVVVGEWTGIPVGKMMSDEVGTVLKLADTLDQRVIGQVHGLEMIAKRIQTSRAGLENPNKPIGVFLLAGPSGVGKTETALALADTLYGGEQNLITINMSEFQEAHTVSTLKGSPPGYVGYGEGGILTEAVRRRPYSVVLLDEVEKAHSDVHEMFFQVFDKGWMEDGEGRFIDFKNTLILLTSNVGSDLIMNMCADPELMPDAESIAKALRPSLLKTFPAALLGRLVVIPYYPLSDAMIGSITRLQLDRIVKRVKGNHGIPFTYDDAVVKLIASRCQELESGGRMIDAILTNTLLPNVSREMLTRMMNGNPVQGVHVSASENEFTYKFD